MNWFLKQIFFLLQQITRVIRYKDFSPEQAITKLHILAIVIIKTMQETLFNKESG